MGTLILVGLSLVAFCRLPTLVEYGRYVEKNYEDYVHLGHLTIL